jgi:predicted kinase
MAGLSPAERAPMASYTPGRTAETYRALGRSAARRLAGGEGAIVDATCGTRGERAELLRPLGGGSPGVAFAECRVPLACALDRAAARLSDPERISDATPEVVARLFESYEPIDELSAATVVGVDGAAPLGRQIRAVVKGADALLRATT